MIRLSWISCLALCFAVAVAATAADPERPPESGAEILLDETTFRVDGDRARETRRVVILVHGSEGRRFGRRVVWYDNFRILRRLHGEITDGDGRRVRRLSRSDVRDRPGSSGYSLYDDFRLREAELYYDRYPYQIEWVWEMEYLTLLNWPSWYPQLGRDAVRRAELHVDVPTGFPVRYRPQFFDGEPEVRNDRRRTIMSWTASAPEARNEPLAPSVWERMPAIHFATDSFQMDDYTGSLASWQEFGHWYRELSTGRDRLPDNALGEVRHLVEGVDDPYRRAQLVYEFLQRRTRYVSVQLGIGGWQPFDAAYVHERRYGDCKALTNYLQTLLRAVGVESFPALIGAGRPDIDPEFPRNAFNHVVLFVPMGERDPVWLEATSQHLPFGQLGPGSEGRHALVVTTQGGQLHRTPTWRAEANTELRHVSARLHEDGSVDAEVVTKYAGHNVGHLRGVLSRVTPRDRDEFLTRKFGLRRASFDSFEVQGLESGAPSVTVSTSLRAQEYAGLAGRRVLLNPNLTRGGISIPPPVDRRRLPVEAASFAYSDRDTVRVDLPPGLMVEIPFEPVVLDTGFARYEANAKVNGSELLYVRHFEIRESTLPPEAYEDYREFLRAASRGDENVVVLVQRE